MKDRLIRILSFIFMILYFGGINAFFFAGAVTDGVRSDATDDEPVASAAVVNEINYEKIKPENEEPTVEVVDEKLIEVTALSQLPEYPTGCESVTAVMYLNYLGIKITSEEFIGKYLPKGSAPHMKNGELVGSDPEKVFLGDPGTSMGWGIWAKGIKKALNGCFELNDENMAAVSVSDKSLDELCDEYINRDIPVMIWATAYMYEPGARVTIKVIDKKKTYDWLLSNHCLLMVGYDRENYIFNDPLTGKTEKYSREACEKAYEANGRQAVVILK